MFWSDRKAAGKELAEKLLEYKNQKDALVLGLPRGGVVVAAEAAKKLNLPLDILVVRKVGAPGNPELAIGAVDENGEGWFNKDICSYLDVPEDYLKKEIEEEKNEAQRRLNLYRQGRLPLDLKSKTVILIDDGIATGATVMAAIQSARGKGASKVVIAAPVIAPDTLENLKNKADRVIYLHAPEYFGAVGAFYENFGQTTDEEVIKIFQPDADPPLAGNYKF